MELYFIPTLLPRSTTRSEWQGMWREARRLKHELSRSNEAKANMLKDTNLPQRIKDDIMYELTFPPLMLGPGMH